MALLQNVRTKAKHRGMTPWQLVQKIRVLDTALDEATCKLIALATENDELKAERSRLEADFDQAAIDLSTALDDLRVAREEASDLRGQLAPYKAADANANRITVPPMVRDTCGPEEEATAPIDVRPLWAAAAAGLLGPVLDPGHTTTR
ncbi:hypothetical protein [Streptomyces sp. NPDC086519]|uniref:hypothetical protein n=1 Tax=Streptomyces sp. NPDC086519 TaxID=3154863 RepID=UPI00342526A2